MSGERTGPGRHVGRGFLAPPADVSDWRWVVLTSSAVQAGLLGALPADATEAATRLGLSAEADRIVLDAPCEFDVDTMPYDRRMEQRAARPADRSGAARAPRAHRRRARPLAASPGDHGPKRAPEIADHCLHQFPEARVLDLAGGHGEYGLEFARRGLDVTLQDLPAVIDLVADWDSLRQSPLTLVPLDAFDGLALREPCLCPMMARPVPPASVTSTWAWLGWGQAGGGGYGAAGGSVGGAVAAS